MLVRRMQICIAQVVGQFGLGTLTAIAIALEAGKRWL